MVNAAEAVAEEEAEEEAEQEEQKMSAFSRDDEQAYPWAITEVAAVGASAVGAAAVGAAAPVPAGGGGEAGEHPFYPLATFRAAKGQPALPFPSPLLVSDNYFRPRWIGLGERRLKNVAFVLEVGAAPASHKLVFLPWGDPRLGWARKLCLSAAVTVLGCAPQVVPGASASRFKRDLGLLHASLAAKAAAAATGGGGGGGASDPTALAAEALQMLLTDPAGAAQSIGEHTAAGGGACDDPLFAAPAAAAAPGEGGGGAGFAALGGEEGMEEDESSAAPSPWPAPLRFLCALSLAEGETLRRAIHAGSEGDFEK